MKMIWPNLTFPPINLWTVPNMNMRVEGSPLTDHEIAMDKALDNGLTTSCYDIPANAKTLDDLIEHKNMPFWLATIFKVCYAFNERSTRNSSATVRREMNKILYYAARGDEKIKKDSNL